MATGDSADILSRIKKLLPGGWFSSVATYRDAVLGAIGDVLAPTYSLIVSSKLQMRLATACGFFIDLWSYDYLGLEIVRRVGELDPAFRLRVQQEVLRERVTRNGMIKAMQDLTGQTPVILEPWNPGDMGALNAGTLALAGSTPGSSNGGGLNAGLALSVNSGCLYVADSVQAAASGGAGAVGTVVSAQVLITVYRPQSQGVPMIAGLNSGAAGLGVGQNELISPSMISGQVTDADVYRTVNNTKPVGVSAWVQLIDATAPSSTINDNFDSNFDSNFA